MKEVRTEELVEEVRTEVLVEEVRTEELVEEVRTEELVEEGYLEGLVGAVYKDHHDLILLTKVTVRDTTISFLLHTLTKGTIRDVEMLDNLKMHIMG